MADVFISYAREDRQSAEQIARGLQAIGLDCFWDTEIPPGQTWADYVEGKLNACKSVIVLWSQYSTKSQWVREEARMGRDKAKLIPAMLDASPMPFGFGEVQAADLSTWRGEANHLGWRSLAQAVHVAVRGADAPTPALAPAPPVQAQPVYAQPAAMAGDAETPSPIGYFQKCLRLYANGKGRARRAEYWWWTLGAFVIFSAAYILDRMAFGLNPVTNMPNSLAFYALAFLALLAPSVAVMSRRFHDVGLNGWLVAVVWGLYFVGAALIAGGNPSGPVLVGAVVLGVLVVLVVPSQAGDNQYGRNPKACDEGHLKPHAGAC